MFSGRISEKVKQQLGAIMHSSMPILKIHVVPVQQQSNGVGCDAYAIAFTNCVLKEKRNPTEVTFNQETMRHNLLRSLAVNKMLPFSTTTRTVKRCRTKQFHWRYTVLVQCAGYHSTTTFLEGKLITHFLAIIQF